MRESTDGVTLRMEVHFNWSRDGGYMAETKVVEFRVPAGLAETLIRAGELFRDMRAMPPFETLEDAEHRMVVVRQVMEFWLLAKALVRTLTIVVTDTPRLLRHMGVEVLESSGEGPDAPTVH